jgi:hypothetical protein
LILSARAAQVDSFITHFGSSCITVSKNIFCSVILSPATTEERKTTDRWTRVLMSTVNIFKLRKRQKDLQQFSKYYLTKQDLGL